MGSRGGARPGAGRKPGSGTNKTKLIAERLADQLQSDGMTPLDVMIAAMKHAIEEGDMRFATQCAKDAAPYIHPRLASTTSEVQMQGTVTFNIKSDFSDD